MTVGGICMRQVDSANPDESVQTAAARLRDRCVGSLLVCDKQDRPIGIVTDRDIALRVVAECVDPAETTVGDVMSVAPQCVLVDTPVEAALQSMRRGAHRRLPVVNDRGELVGVISLDDILDLIAEEFRDIGGLLRNEGPASLLRAR